MKKRLFTLFMFALSIAPKTQTMDWNFDFGNIDPKYFRYAREFADGMANTAAEAARMAKEHMESNIAKEMRELEARLKNARSDQERCIIMQQMAELSKHKHDREAKFSDVEADVIRVVPNLFQSAQDMLKEEQRAKHRLNEQAIKADAKRKASIENLKQKLEFIKDPKNLKMIGFFTVGVSAGVFGAWHGTKLAANLLQAYMQKVPTIAEETSLISYKQKLTNYLTSKTVESAVSDVILEKNLSDRIERIATSLQNTVKNNGYFRHMLFYGPPGTGKTMLAKRLARSSGLEYIYFAGGSALDQLPIEEALSKLTELFEFAKYSKKKLMIIIDEAEVLLADRSKNLSDKTRKLLNLLLGYTGTETSNFIIVALTNRPEDLDSAFLSRCDEQVKIGAPSFEQRKAILESYVNKLLISRAKEPVAPSIFSRLLGVATPPKALIIEDNVLSSNALEDIALKLDNFVGRDISKLVIAMQSEAYASPDCSITKDLIDKVVQQKIDQKNLENIFKDNI